MLRRLARIAAPCAALVLSACAGGDAAARRDVVTLRADVEALRQQNGALLRRLDALESRLERSDARAARPAVPPSPVEPAAPLVPPDLAVVRVAPPRQQAEEPPQRVILSDSPVRPGRPAPRLPTSVPVSEPDPDRLDALAEPAGRELSAQAEGELVAARRKPGVDRAHALEAFVARYPRHPSADNALVEAARAYADLGRAEAACDLARRVPQDYPAGDAVSGAQEIVVRCERSRP